jgi:hypothetical protein
MGHVDALSSGFMWVTTTGDSRSSVEVSYALLSSRKLPPDEETLVRACKRLSDASKTLTTRDHMICISGTSTPLNSFGDEC